MDHLTTIIELQNDIEDALTNQQKIQGYHPERTIRRIIMTIHTIQILLSIVWFGNYFGWVQKRIS